MRSCGQGSSSNRLRRPAALRWGRTRCRPFSWAIRASSTSRPPRPRSTAGRCRPRRSSAWPRSGPGSRSAAVDPDDRPAERAHARVDVGPHAPAARAPLHYPRRLLLASLAPPAVEDHLGPVDVEKRALEIAVIADGLARDDEEQSVPPLLEDVRDVEHPDELAQARVDDARVAAVGAHHGVDLLDAHAARAAVLGRELDPSPAGIVHRPTPRAEKMSQSKMFRETR